ncbi:hypothetical protein BGZ63DRAFT_19973 [Mariannaea sp. PMI_226]|nr:hypothetical protein BGZ63DRAFT_19973 [Mariannaea sp. PMI_226]
MFVCPVRVFLSVSRGGSGGGVFVVICRLSFSLSILVHLGLERIMAYIPGSFVMGFSIPVIVPVTIIDPPPFSMPAIIHSGFASSRELVLPQCLVT